MSDSYEGSVILERKTSSGDFAHLATSRETSYLDTGRTAEKPIHTDFACSQKMDKSQSILKK